MCDSILPVSFEAVEIFSKKTSEICGIEDPLCRRICGEHIIINKDYINVHPVMLIHINNIIILQS